MVAPLFILFAAMCLPILYSFLCFDKLVKYQHDNRHQEWLKDGGTHGFFWIPVGQSPSAWLMGSLARNLHCFTLLFRSRPWIDADADLRRTRKRYQLSNVIYLLFFAMFAIAAIYFTTNSAAERLKKQDQKQSAHSRRVASSGKAALTHHHRK